MKWWCQQFYDFDEFGTQFRSFDSEEILSVISHSFPFRIMKFIASEFVSSSFGHFQCFCRSFYIYISYFFSYGRMFNWFDHFWFSNGFCFENSYFVRTFALSNRFYLIIEMSRFPKDFFPCHLLWYAFRVITYGTCMKTLNNSVVLR